MVGWIITLNMFVEQFRPSVLETSAGFHMEERTYAVDSVRLKYMNLFLIKKLHRHVYVHKAKFIVSFPFCAS